MKKLFTLFAFSFLITAAANAQEDPKTATPQSATAGEAVPQQAKPQPPARPAQMRTDTIKGNAGRMVAIVDAKGDCANGMKSLGITNRSTDRSLMARVDVIMTFGGRMSKKSVLIDNLAAGETRFVGCGGCVDNQTGKTCTTYKIMAAQYK